MRRKPEKRDETEEISLDDTQEYFTAPARDVPPPEPETEVISDETAEYEAFPGGEGEGGQETVEFDDLEDEYFDEEFYEEPLDEAPIDAEPEPAEERDGPEPALERMKIAWASLIADARKVDVPGVGAKSREGRRAGKVDDKTSSAIDVDDPGNGRGATEEVGADGSAAAPGLNVGRVSALVAVLVVALAVGVGAYLIGKGSGEDVTAAKLEGQAAGKKAGAIEGAAKGYPAGFQKGRDAGFRKAYTHAYKINYKRAFEQAGQDVPADKDIDVPDP